MAIKLLENIGIENTGIGASALNNLITGNKSGIVGNYLNECAFTATGNTIIIDKGLLIICGRQVELDAIESITLSSSPSEDERYQVVIELLKEETGEVTASIFARKPSTLIQENLMKDGYTYQLELGRVTHKKTGQVTEVSRTASILYGQSGAGADIEVGEVNTQMISTELPAEVNINKVLDDGKTKLNFDFSLPKPYEESVANIVSAVTTTGNPVNIQNTNDGFVDRVKILGGKNLISNNVADWEQGSVSENTAIGTTYSDIKMSSTTRIRTKELIRVKNPITFSFNDSLFDVFITLFDENQLYLGQWAGWKLTTFTETRNCEYMAIAVRKKDNSTITASDIETVFLQGELGSTATAYEPYTVISSPLTGKRVGKNLFNDTVVTFQNPSNYLNGEYTVSSLGVYTNSWIDINNLPAGTYTFSINIKNNSVDKVLGDVSVRKYNSHTPIYMSKTFSSATVAITTTFSIPVGEIGVRIYLYSNSSGISYNTSLTFSNFQIEKGSTATDYEPYTATEFSIPLKNTSGNTLSLNPADVIEIIDGKYHLNNTELHDESQDVLRSIPTYQGQTNLIGNQPFTFDVTEFQLGLESIDAMLTLPDGKRVNVLTKDRMVYITSGEYNGKTLDYVLQELKQHLEAIYTMLNT